MGALHSHSELHITKQSWLGSIFKTHSFLLSSPFFSSTRSRWTSSQRCVHPRPPLQGCGLTGGAPPGAEQRDVQDTESPAEETTEVNLATSVRRLGLTRIKKKKMRPAVLVIFHSAPWKVVSWQFQVLLSSLWSLQFSLFLFLFVQVLKKLWSHCKRNNVLDFQSWDWI